MRNKLIALLVLGAILSCSSAFAAKKEEAIPTNPVEWQVSASDAYKSLNSRPNWSIIEENQFGIFAYDMNSLSFLTHKKQKDKNIVEGTVKTVFTNKLMQKQLNERYASVLKPKERVSYWLLFMRFDIAANTFTIKKTEYYSNKDTLLDTAIKKQEMKAIPEKSFAEQMYKICKDWAEENKNAL